MPERIVLVTTDLPFRGADRDRLAAIVAPDRMVEVAPGDAAGMAAALAEAEIVVTAGDIDERHLAAPKLKWVHTNISGMTRSALPAVFAKGLVVTGAAGRSAPALAEHAMMFILALNANLIGFYEAQKRHAWRGVAGLERLTALHGRTVGIVGMGATAVELVTRCRAFGMRILGFRRRDLPPPPGVERVYSTDRGETVMPLVEASDFIVVVTSLSDATYHLIGSREIAAMKPGAVLINLARGPVVDEAALAEALHARRIGGAGLDVFDREPLPPESPLWDAPNTLITPHFTVPVSDRNARTLAIIAENFRRYRAGEEMLNRLMPEDVYTRPLADEG